MKIVIHFLVLVSISLSGCSIIRLFVLENKSNVAADIQIIAKKDSQLFLLVVDETDTVYQQSGDTLKFSIQPKTELTLFFGRGTWTMENNLENLASEIESFEIKHPDTNISISDSTQLRKYLSKHYSNPFVKSVIRIKIK